MLYKLPLKGSQNKKETQSLSLELIICSLAIQSHVLKID